MYELMKRGRTASPPQLSRRNALKLSGGLGAALALAACSGPTTTSTSSGGAGTPAPTELTKIGLDYPFTQIPIFATLVKLATAVAQSRGIELVTTNDEAKVDLQAANLTTWVNQKMPAIVSFPMVFEATERIAQQALDAGLIWVTYGGTMENQSADIQFSFLDSGRLLGEAAAAWANEELGGTGKIAFLTDRTIQLGRDRTSGMIDAFAAAAPGVDVVADEQAIDPDTGYSTTTAILAKHPDLHLLLAVTDAAAYGGFKALQQSGRDDADPQTFVGGQDGAVPSLLAIKEGTFYRASAALTPNDIANAIIDVPLAVAAGDPNPSVDLPVALVQRDDVDTIDELLAQNS